MKKYKDSTKLGIIDQIFEKVEIISEILTDAEIEPLVSKLEAFTLDALNSILDMIDITTKFLKDEIKEL